MRFITLIIVLSGALAVGCSALRALTPADTSALQIPPLILATSTYTPQPPPSPTPSLIAVQPTIPQAPTKTPTAKPRTPTPAPIPSTATAPPSATLASSASPAADAVLVGAGDMRNCNDGLKQTAALINTIPGTVINLGDLTVTGAASEYPCYDAAWGQFKNRTLPVLGNHEYLTKDAAGYFGYWGQAAHGPGGYYSVDVGAWHLIILNSNCSNVGGCQMGSAQEQWLKADLAAHPRQCTLAMWHHPRFNSGKQGNTTAVTPFLQDLYNAGVHLVLNGHEHNYERFARMDPTGKADPNGIREFIVGTGGAGGGSWVATQPNSEVHAVSALGAIKLTLHTTSYDWQFIPTAGTTFTDSGNESCK